MCDEQRARPLSLLDLVRELFEKARTTSYSCDLNTLGGQPFYDRAADADAHFGNQRRLSDKRTPRSVAGCRRKADDAARCGASEKRACASSDVQSE